jgi:hypothetical protein
MDVDCNKAPMSCNSFCKLGARQRTALIIILLIILLLLIE